ncbi:MULTISPECIES: ferric iron uptake transcriptional regulator [Testudinibacter]|uniref:Ferric uptake regulation protein n=1 Tax=Testudinibacter aquarius TaxID=1524974 RepID=A0A4V2W236_9PAST|nr:MULTISPECIES: ferric iron uptake transcriptional regulator [Testudinibacter]TNG94665.1 ferric iron uptake transcriptional regulator [Pasteurellaceae bacterium UScroc12]TNG97479.1 ferric iron uptake transcriptional regulator [Pasteurellaceae bacterium UScroc31]TNG98344.1 ferric iron uptake transcriptional regulator [Pasteurellaceae bacterium USgator41]TNH02752.1 ferric iron uptake transcriptional regulator [Pasteurellaceae bacterium USgator11]TNH04421.1 ferric iron uptake transcriptional reg
MSEDNIKLLKKAGLKITEPRLKILALMQNHHNTEYQHFSAEDIYKMLLEQGEEIGLATVYRVLNQFDEADILIRHNFEGNKSVFELAPIDHHDHIICMDCGKVIEFSDDIIEKRQKEISKEYGIQLENHSLYLYGKCNDIKNCDEPSKK